MIASFANTKRQLRIVVADDESFMRKYLQTILPRLGHQVVAVACTGRELVEQCRDNQPDLVITDVNMPEMDGLEAAAAIYERHPLPIIVISGFHGPAVVERTVAAHVMAYLVKPIKQADLEPVISLAVLRFEQMQSLQAETAALRDDLGQQSMIEQALQVLMNWPQQGQNEAFRRLQQMAADEQLDLHEIARRIVEAAPRPDPPGTAPPSS